MRTSDLLIIDDDAAVVNGLRRVFSGEFTVETASSGEAAIEFLGEGRHFGVVVCDQRMAGMDGIETLSTFRDKAPLTSRILLTGYADEIVLRDAISRASVFCVLDKPCSKEALGGAILEGLDLHERSIDQRRGVERAVLGAVRMLAEIQESFGLTPGPHRGRITDIGRKIARDQGVCALWELDAALMLSGLDGLLRFTGDKAPIRTPHEFVTAVLGQVPKFRRLAEAVAYRHKNFDGTGSPSNLISGKSIPAFGRLLRVLGEFERQLGEGRSEVDTVKDMESQAHAFDPDYLRALAEEAARKDEEPEQEV